MTLPSRHRIRKFEPWRSEAEDATSRSRRLPTILNLRVSGEKTFCFFETWRPEWGSSLRFSTFQAGSISLCTRAPSNVPVIWTTLSNIRMVSWVGSFPEASDNLVSVVEHRADWPRYVTYDLSPQLLIIKTEYNKHSSQQELSSPRKYIATKGLFRL